MHGLIYTLAGLAGIVGIIITVLTVIIRAKRIKEITQDDPYVYGSLYPYLQKKIIVDLGMIGFFCYVVFQSFNKLSA